MVRGVINCIFPAGYKGLVAEGKCTRADAAVDIHNVDINDLIITCPGLSKTSAYYAKGGVESYYLGSKVGKKLRCIYDKNAQLKSRGLKAFIHPVTRLECRMMEGVQISEVSSVVNPFGAINVCEFSELPNLDDERFILFKALCVSNGGQNALLAVSKNQRKKYRDYLKLGAPKWWEPKSIWSGWPQVVSTALASKPAFDFADAVGLSNL